VPGHLYRLVAPTLPETYWHYYLGDNSNEYESQHVDVCGNVWTWVFNSTNQNLKTVANPLGHTTTLEYAATPAQLIHEVKTVTNPLSKTWTYEYDGVGNLTKATDPLSNRTDFAYDSLNNLESVTPPGATANTVNTAKQVEINYTDSLHPTSPTEIIEPIPQNGGSMSTTYITYYHDNDATGSGIDPADWNGELKDVTDPNGVVTRFTYDTWGQQHEEIENPSSSTPYANDFWPTLSSAVKMNEGGVRVNNTMLQRFMPNCDSTPWRSGTTTLNANGSATGSDCDALVLLVEPPFCDITQNPAISRTLSAGCAQYDLSPTGQLLGMDRCVEDPLASGAHASSDRNFDYLYDDLDRPLQQSLVTEEPTEVPGYTIGTTIAPRVFEYDYDDLNGTYTVTGPDGDVVEVQLDDAARADSVVRTVGSRTIEAEYTYDNAGRVTRIDQGNGNWVERAYDDANRLTRITNKHLNGRTMLQQVFAWTRDGLIEEITETDTATVVGETITATVSFQYDNRNRLTRETRDDSGATGVPPVEYDMEYTYDRGGNRLTKVDHLAGHTTTYEYDITSTTDGDQHNNRLLYQETEFVSLGLIAEQRWYVYGSDGNLARLVRRNALLLEVFWFYYDTGGRLWMTVFGQADDYDEQTLALSNIYYISAAEYRYDGGRQRYLVRERDPNNNFVVTNPGQWRDYSGDSIHRDYSVNPTTSAITNGDAHLAGAGYDDGTTNAPNYFGADQIGTTRRICDSAGTPAVLHRKISTAFGESISTVNVQSFDHPRYGYAGAWGYEEPRSGDPLEELGWLHVGERYYAPELGRFVQRDPIGLRGGVNTYLYAKNRPTLRIDPTGLFSFKGAIVGALTGAGCGAIKGGGVVGGVIWGLGGAITGGYEDGDEEWIIGVAVDANDAVSAAIARLAEGPEITGNNANNGPNNGNDNTSSPAGPAGSNSDNNSSNSNSGG